MRRFGALDLPTDTEPINHCKSTSNADARQCWHDKERPETRDRSRGDRRVAGGSRSTSAFFSTVCVASVYRDRRVPGQACDGHSPGEIILKLDEERRRSSSLVISLSILSVLSLVSILSFCHSREISVSVYGCTYGTYISLTESRITYCRGTSVQHAEQNSTTRHWRNACRVLSLALRADGTPARSRWRGARSTADCPHSDAPCTASSARRTCLRPYRRENDDGRGSNLSSTASETGSRRRSSQRDRSCFFHSPRACQCVVFAHMGSPYIKCV
jgi:hypothetical protein